MRKSLVFILSITLLACHTNAKKADANDTSSQDKDERSLVWSDEFDGDALDTSNWSEETGDHGWGNNEWQNYTDEQQNVTVSNGTLKITAKKTGDGQNVGDYASARLNSIKRFTYGRMEIRAKMPEHKGNGVWPAIWMLGEDIKSISWPDCGEIDIMEYVSFDPGRVHQTIHSVANNHMNGTQLSTGAMELPSIEEEFHNYGIVWTTDKLDFYIDNPQNITLSIEKPDNPTNDNWPFDKGYYFLLNVAVGGNWGGEKGVDDSIFPATMEIDYVRVYQ